MKNTFRNIYVVVFCMLVFSLQTISVSAQVGVGTLTPNASSQLDVSATNKGILIPRVTLGSVNK
jgi:hypothetical protein